MNTDVLVFAKRVYEKLTGYYDEQRRLYSCQKAHLKEYESKDTGIDKLYQGLLSGTGIAGQDIHSGSLKKIYKEEADKTRGALEEFKNSFLTGNEKEEELYAILLDNDLEKLESIAKRGDNPYVNFVSMLKHLNDLGGDIVYTNEIRELEKYIKSAGKIPVIKGLDKADTSVFQDTLEAMKIVSDLVNDKGDKPLVSRAQNYAQRTDNRYAKRWFENLADDLEKRIQKEKNEARHRRELDAQDTRLARRYRRSVIGEGISSCFEAIFGEPGELIKTMLILLIPSFIVSCFLGMHVQFLVAWVDNYLKWGILVIIIDFIATAAWRIHEGVY